MVPKKQTDFGSPWPKEGEKGREIAERGVRDIKEYYSPPHGSLPAPHEPAARSSWPQAMTDVPGEGGKNKSFVPFPERMKPGVALKKLPTKSSPYEGIWQTEGKRK